MESEQKHSTFKIDAKTIVDMMFDARMIKDDVTRDQIQIFQELIEYTMNSRFESVQRAEKLFNSIKK